MIDGCVAEYAKDSDDACPLKVSQGNHSTILVYDSQQADAKDDSQSQFTAEFHMEGPYGFHWQDNQNDVKNEVDYTGSKPIFSLIAAFTWCGRLPLLLEWDTDQR